MATIAKISGVAFTSIAKVCGAAKATIDKVMGVDVPVAFTYGTLDPAANGGTLSGGNLTWSSSVGDKGCNGTPIIGSGKMIYFEFRYDTIASSRNPMIGIGLSGTSVSQSNIQSMGSQWLLGANGDRYRTGNPDSDLFGDFSAGQWGGLAYNQTAGKLWLRNAAGWSGDPVAGTGEAWSSVTGDIVARIVTADANAQGTFNFGATAFQYAVPTGYVDRVGT